jgi:hypothetical protein
MADSYFDIRLSEEQIRELQGLVVAMAEGSEDDSDLAFWEGISSALHVIPCPACNPPQN